MKTVLCITLNPAIDLTITLDVLTLGAVNRASENQLGAAGKGLNAAHVLSELGINAIASGFLGDDNDEIFERLFKSHKTFISDAGIGQLTDGFVKVTGATRTNVKIVDKQGYTTDINGQGFLIDNDAKQALFKRLVQYAKEADAVLVAGSLPKGFTTRDFDELLDLLTQNNTKIAVDVSGDALKAALKHNLWFIKPNNDELSGAFDRQITTLDEQLSAIQEISGDIEHVLVSMGDKGVHWFKKSGQKRQIYHAIPPKMTVKSTVGAGDTMVAGMIFGLLQNFDDKTLLCHTTALSAHAVTVIGVQVPKRNELLNLIAKVQIFNKGIA